MTVRIAAALALGVLAGNAALADVKAGTQAWHQGDWKKAVDEWRGPAIAGDADAQFNMGQAYKLGRGVPTDMTQAETWFAKAAAQGHPLAIDNYGLALFQEGRRAEALPWLEKSAARDEKRAELVLGTMLFNGDGAERDWVRAYALISRSSQQGLAQAGQTLAQMDGYVTPEQREQGTAMAAKIAADGRMAAASEMPSPAAAAPSRGTVATTPLPPSTANGPVRPAAAPPASTATETLPGAATIHPVAAPRPKPTPKPVPTPSSTPKPAPTAPKPVAAGRFRVQLGAFKDANNARALWARIGGKVGGQPSYPQAGAVTRLQAGPFASEADAQRACRAAGVPCTVVPGR